MDDYLDDYSEKLHRDLLAMNARKNYILSVRRWLRARIVPHDFKGRREIMFAPASVVIAMFFEACGGGGRWNASNCCSA